MDLHFLSDMGISHSQTRAETRLSTLPLTIGNWIDGEERFAASNRRFLKTNPRNGQMLAQVTRSGAEDVEFAVRAANRAVRKWDARGFASRAEYLYSFSEAVEEYFPAIVQLLSLETGRSERDVEAEVQSALDLTVLILTESRQLGAQSASQITTQFELGYRTPKGVVAAIHSGTMPFLHFIRTAYASLVTGNTLVWKPSMTVPCLASAICEITRECCFPDGVINIVHGTGPETGWALAANPAVKIIEFTGSFSAAKEVLNFQNNGTKFVGTITGSIPVVVCEDANLKTAARTAARSAFDKERKLHDVRDVYVHESVYESFRDLIVRESYRYQPAPLPRERKLLDMLHKIDGITAGKSQLLSGGYRLMDESHRSGNFLAPTVIEMHQQDSRCLLPDISSPVVCLHKAAKLWEIIVKIGDNSTIPPSIIIHTRNHDLAREILNDAKAASVVINGSAEFYATAVNEDYLKQFYSYTSVIRANDDDDSLTDFS